VTVSERRSIGVAAFIECRDRVLRGANITTVFLQGVAAPVTEQQAKARLLGILTSHAVFLFHRPERGIEKTMLQVLGRSTSINVRKILWLCAELDLPIVHEAWDSEDRSNRSQEFKEWNPNGLVPVIKDGDFVLWESNAICRYLAALHGREDLLPTDVRRRAVVEQWMDWQTTQLNNSWRYAFFALVRKAATHTDPKAIEASVADWNRHMQILEAQLQRTGKFVTGAEFTLADLVLGLSTHRWFMTPMEQAHLPAVAAFYERLSTRPAFMTYVRNGVP